MKIPIAILFFGVALIGSLAAPRFGLPSTRDIFAMLAAIRSNRPAGLILFIFAYFLFVPLALLLYFFVGIAAIIIYPVTFFLTLIGNPPLSVEQENASTAASNLASHPSPQITKAAAVEVTQTTEPCPNCCRQLDGAYIYQCKTCGQFCCWRPETPTASAEGCMEHAPVNPVTGRADDTCPHCHTPSSYPWTTNFIPVRRVKLH